MESIIARALEYTLKYWLKSFSRDQFKLQGRTAQLSNLDINGDALHSSFGLPPALNVASAKVGKLEISLPSVSNVQVEPIVVQIDRLDLILEENAEADASKSPRSAQSTSSSGIGSGYGFADKIADGMTIEVRTVTLLLETRGAGRRGVGATWTPPMASITIRNLILYTTNENWEVVSLKEARDSSGNKNHIYVFKKLEWGSLSIDLLPHPDMFTDARPQGANKRDDDGAKRVFFGGERLLDGISGQANITVQRTQLNDPLGLEVRLHISEAICPALSEPGLRAFLRFLTGLYVCLNRGDVDSMSQQRSTEAAVRSLVSVIVDHVFLCIKDAEFSLELLMQSLSFSRASISDDGGNAKNLTVIEIGGLFLRDTFSRPPCTLIQPSMQGLAEDFHQIPDFAKNFCPPIYPLRNQHCQASNGAPFVSIYSVQINPLPAPPMLASETVINCKPLMIHLQEESCLRISSFLADGIVVGPGSVLPDGSVISLTVTLQELDVTVPLDIRKSENEYGSSDKASVQNLFSGARLHIENIFLFESPSLRLTLLDLEKDPACFCLWEDQPIDAGHKKWSAGASYLGLLLETYDDARRLQNRPAEHLGSWRCVEMKETCIQVAMATPDGSPLTCIPPPGGVVRVGIAFNQYLTNASVEQLFFVLDLYGYLGEVSEKISIVGKNSKMTTPSNDSWCDELMSKVPCDTAVSFSVKDLQLQFLEKSCTTTPGRPLVLFTGEDLFIKVGHRTLGGGIAISSTMRWENVEVACLETKEISMQDDGVLPSPGTTGSLVAAKGGPELRPVLWVQHKGKKHSSGSHRGVPFLNVSISHVIPSQAQDAGWHTLNVSSCIAGVCLGGGMSYTEALLHRFGVLGPDGGPSEGLLKGIENFSSGPLSKAFMASSPRMVDTSPKYWDCEEGYDSLFPHLGWPDEVEVLVDFRDWLFALESVQEMNGNLWFDNLETAKREDKCWHATFQSLKIKAKNCPKDMLKGCVKSPGAQKYPVELITIGVEGIQILKPYVQTNITPADHPINGNVESELKEAGAVNFEVRMAAPEHHSDSATENWVVENFKFSVDQPIEAVVTKDELQHLALLCRSEVDSVGRIAVGILRILKLEGSIGQAAIDQLSNLGSGSFDKIFTPCQLSRDNSVVSFEHSLCSNRTSVSAYSSTRTVVASLEKQVEDTESKCTALLAELGESQPSSEYLDRVKELGLQIDVIRSLLSQLKTQDLPF